MRVLHLGKYYAPQRGGIERYLQDLAEWCARQGDAVAALVHQPPGCRRSARETIGGVEVRRAGCLAELVYTPVSPAFPLELARALREFRPELLHLHLPNPSCFAALALPAARRLPWIVHWHADVPPDGPDWRLRTAYRAYRPFEQAVLRRAQAVIATSHPYLDASLALAPWRAKALVVPLGLGEPQAAGAVPAGDGVSGTKAAAAPRADAQAPSPQARSRPDGNAEAAPLRLLAVGRLSHYKGFDVLIEALAALPDARLHLVGSGERERALRALARSRGLEARIAFAGTVDEAALASAYARADAFVLPSLDRSEAFGLVLLEAMRAGLPVIASAIPGSGVGTVVADGETGFTVPPGDAAALAAAIARLRAPDLRARLGAAGRARWAGRFTLPESAAAVREAYRRALG